MILNSIQLKEESLKLCSVLWRKDTARYLECTISREDHRDPMCVFQSPYSGENCVYADIGPYGQQTPANISGKKIELN